VPVGYKLVEKGGVFGSNTMLTPEKLNEVYVDTRWGSRPFELWHGDITKLNFPINLLLIAQPGDHPTYSLRKSLKSELGISVRDLDETKELDFVQPLGVWISREIQSEKIRRILCIKIMPDSTAPHKIRAFLVLPILAARRIELGTICLPVLGAGGIGLKAEEVVRPILEGSFSALSEIKEINRICFVDIAAVKAHEMSKAMDDVLGRAKLTIPKGKDADRIRRGVSNAIDKATAIDPDIHEIATEIRAAIKPESLPVHVGNAGRQLSEYILKRLVPLPANQSLFDRIERAVPLPISDRIDNLKSTPAAFWMNGYFHLLRLLGNETSHHEFSKRVPKSIEENDIVLILLAIERVLGFWVAWRKDPPDTHSSHSKDVAAS
jgi:hypothetical protein